MGLKENAGEDGVEKQGVTGTVTARTTDLERVAVTGRSP